MRKLSGLFNRARLRVALRQDQRGEFSLAVFIGLICFAAWFTHLYVCFTDGRWGFLIAGALFFPVAIIHGAGTWLGIW